MHMQLHHLHYPAVCLSGRDKGHRSCYETISMYLVSSIVARILRSLSNFAVS